MLPSPGSGDSTSSADAVAGGVVVAAEPDAWAAVEPAAPLLAACALSADAAVVAVAVVVVRVLLSSWLPAPMVERAPPSVLVDALPSLAPRQRPRGQRIRGLRLSCVVPEKLPGGACTGRAAGGDALVEPLPRAAPGGAGRCINACGRGEARPSAV